MPLTQNKQLKVNVSDDRLTAVLALNPGMPHVLLNADQIASELAALNLVIDEQAHKTIEEFAQTLAREEVPEPVVVARGIAPVHDKTGRLEKLYVDPADSDPLDADRQSHYDRSNIVTVDKDTPLIRIIPPETGSDGADVFGKPIARKLGREASIRLGPNTRQEQNLILADAPGQVEFLGDRISVNAVLEINSDVDFSVGNIDFPGDVVIAKNVLDLFKVHAAGSITVHGIVEAAEIHAGKDLHVNGGVAGKEKGNLSAGNDLHAKYITNAAISAQHDITVHTEILHSTLICRGRLVVETGQLVGGTTAARCGLQVHNLGSDADTRTIVDVGIDLAVKELFLRLEPKIAQSFAKAEKTRQIVEPLLANQKRLSAEQKEKATELLYTAYDLADNARGMIEQIRAAYAEMQENAVQEVVVTGTIFPGAILNFPKVQSVVRNALTGPLTITPRKIDHILKVVAVDKNSAAVHALDSAAAPDLTWQRLENLLAQHP